MDYPKLRYGLEAIPIQDGTKQKILLRDRLGYSDKTLVFRPDFIHILAKMDGTNSLRDLQWIYTKTTGDLLFSEHLEALLKTLDDALFLENQRYIQFVAAQVAAYRKDPVRRMQYAGKSYPAEPGALSEELKGFFDPQAGGPGPVGRSRDERTVVGLAAPHIDIRAGGPCFAHGYKAVLEAQPPKTWVVLATGHEPIDNFFAVTLKDFETPLGVIECDREFSENLLSGAPRDLLASEYNHHREHTVEFQAVFLAYLQPEAQIVPILCSFSLQDWEEQHAYIMEVCELLRTLAEKSGKPVGFLASVDLAHIGPRYGDATPPSQATLSYHLEKDRLLLDALSACDPKRFMEIIKTENNTRRICGVPPLCVLATVLEGNAYGELKHHGHAVVDHQNSFVTFTSMVFYARTG